MEMGRTKSLWTGVGSKAEPANSPGKGQSSYKSRRNSPDQRLTWAITLLALRAFVRLSILAFGLLACWQDLAHNIGIKLRIPNHSLQGTSQTLLYALLLKMEIH